MTNIVNYPDDKLPNLFQRMMRILEEHNKRFYVTPNSNYLSMTGNTADIIGTLSDEIADLRKIAADAAKFCLNIRTDRDLVKLPFAKCPASRRIINYVIKQPWYFTPAAVGKAPVAAEEGDLPTL